MSLLPSQLGRGALLRVEEGLRVLSCESVEALAVKFGRTRFCLPQRAAGRCRSARGRCVGRARVVGVRARQLFSEWLLFLFAARAGRRSAAKTPGSGQATDLRLQMTKFVCLRARLRAVRRRAICSPSLGEGEACKRGFSSKRHARVGESFSTGSWSALAVHRGFNEGRGP